MYMLVFLSIPTCQYITVLASVSQYPTIHLGLFFFLFLRVSKEIMSESSVPVVPGYFGDDQSDQKLSEEAEKLG